MSFSEFFDYNDRLNYENQHIPIYNQYDQDDDQDDQDAEDYSDGQSSYQSDQSDDWKYISPANHVPLSKRCIDAACIGDLDTIIELSENPFMVYDNDTIYFAASNGQFDVVVWLYENVDKKWTNPINGAIINGHVDIVKWLDENSIVNYTDKDICDAIIYGQFKLAKSLKKNKYGNYRRLDGIYEYRINCISAYIQRIVDNPEYVDDIKPQIKLLKRLGYILNYKVKSKRQIITDKYISPPNHKQRESNSSERRSNKSKDSNAWSSNLNTIVYNIKKVRI